MNGEEEVQWEVLLVRSILWFEEEREEAVVASVLRDTEGHELVDEGDKVLEGLEDQSD